MKSCKSCFWCRLAFHPFYTWKCKMGQSMLWHEHNYMERPKWHGWFCKRYVNSKKVYEDFPDHMNNQ